MAMLPDDLLEMAECQKDDLKRRIREFEDERDQLRAELGRLQRNEDCVQRLIVWSAENGWNGVDNSKILDSFIIGLFDELRAELAAAKDKISVLENQKAAAEYAVAEIWNKNGPHPKLGWMPSGILQGMVERGERVVRERTVLAAHVERLREALYAISERLTETFWRRDCDHIRHAREEIGCNGAKFRAIENLLEAALAATPAQSLAAHDAALLREVADGVDKIAVVSALDTPQSMRDLIADAIRAKADRIAKEAANGQA